MSTPATATASPHPAEAPLLDFCPALPVSHSSSLPGRRRPPTRSTRLLKTIGPSSNSPAVVPYSPSLLPGLPQMVKSDFGRRPFSRISLPPDAPTEYSAPFAVSPSKTDPQSFGNPILSTTSTPLAFSALHTQTIQSRLGRSRSTSSAQAEGESSAAGHASADEECCVQASEQESLVPHQRLSLRILLADLPEPPRMSARPKPLPTKRPSRENIKSRQVTAQGSPRPKLSRGSPIDLANSPRRPDFSQDQQTETPRQPAKTGVADSAYTTPEQVQATPIPSKRWRSKSPDMNKPLRLLDENMSLYEALESGTCVARGRPLIPEPPCAADIAPLSSPRLSSKPASTFSSAPPSRAPTAPNSPSVQSASSHGSSVSVRAIATLDFSRPKGEQFSSRIDYRSLSTSSSSLPASRTSSASYAHAQSPSWLTPMSDASGRSGGGTSDKSGGASDFGYFPRMRLEPSPEIRAGRVGRTSEVGEAAEERGEVEDVLGIREATGVLRGVQSLRAGGVALTSGRVGQELAKAGRSTEVPVGMAPSGRKSTIG